MGALTAGAGARASVVVVVVVVIAAVTTAAAAVAAVAAAAAAATTAPSRRRSGSSDHGSNGSGSDSVRVCVGSCCARGIAGLACGEPQCPNAGPPQGQHPGRDGGLGRSARRRGRRRRGG
jgi:hypothetical protein